MFPYLDGKHDECHEYHDDNQELRGPDFGGDVSKPHRGEGDHAEVERVKQGQVVACPLEVLDTADAGGDHERRRSESDTKKETNQTPDMSQLQIPKKHSISFLSLLIW